jgi:hypothetical protein
MTTAIGGGFLSLNKFSWAVLYYNLSKNAVYYRALVRRA